MISGQLPSASMRSPCRSASSSAARPTVRRTTAARGSCPLADLRSKTLPRRVGAFVGEWYAMLICRMLIRRISRQSSSEVARKMGTSSALPFTKMGGNSSNWHEHSVTALTV